MVSKELRSDPANPAQRGTPADMVHHGLRMGGDKEFWDEARDSFMAPHAGQHPEERRRQWVRDMYDKDMLETEGDNDFTGYTTGPLPNLERLLDGGFKISPKTAIDDGEWRLLGTLIKRYKVSPHQEVSPGVSLLAHAIRERSEACVTILHGLGAKLSDPGVKEALEDCEGSKSGRQLLDPTLRMFAGLKVTAGQIDRFRQG